MAMSAFQSQLREWWWRVFSFILLVVAINAAISFVYSRLYPSHCTRSSRVPLHVLLESLELLDEPSPLYLSVDTPLLPLSDKDLVVRSAHVNPQSGGSSSHANSTIILIEVRRSLVERKAFESCGVGAYSSSKFEVVPIDGDSCNAKERFPHTQALLYCYDIPAPHLDRAWVTYGKAVSGETVSVTAWAEQPVIHYRKRNGMGSVVVCSAMLPHYTPFVEDWVRYQKTLGVDHVHLTLDSVFLNQGKFDEEFLQRSAEEFYLTVAFWHRWLNDTDICDRSLDLALYDCVLQFQRFYSHVLLADPRDFFVPHDSTTAAAAAATTSKLPSLLSRLCPTAHCLFERRSLVYQSCKKAGDDGNVTAILDTTGPPQKDGYLSVYKSALLSHTSANPRLPVLSPGSAKVVPAEKKGYFVRLVRHANTSNVRILPELEHC